MNDTAKSVSIDSINNAPIETPPAEVNGNEKNPLTGIRDSRLDQHLGWIGGFVGGGHEKSGNVASIVIILSFFLVIGCLIALAFVASEATSIIDILKTTISSCFAAISGAIGYIFGKGNSDKN